ANCELQAARLKRELQNYEKAASCELQAARLKKVTELSVS
ncbi:MAG: hypothetical protein JWM28_1333, partial [Chitinophagaceae bacterium]|nr:hypothetical protein [Chitinophagaceae bacterium]